MEHPMGSVEDLRQHIQQLTKKLREVEIYNNTLRRLNINYWKIIVKYRKKLGDMGLEINEN